MPITSKKPSLPSDDKRWRIVVGTMRRHGFAREALIETLHTVQEYFGYLDKPSLRFVAASLRVPLSQAYGVATFYHFFTLKPPGKHTCLVCFGTACYIKGAGQLLAAAEASLNVKAGNHVGRECFSVDLRAASVRAAWRRLLFLMEKPPAMSMKPLSKAGWRMEKLMTLEELEQIANERRAAKEKSPRALNVCVAAGCLSLHSDAIKSALEKEVQRTGANCRVAGTAAWGFAHRDRW